MGQDETGLVYSTWRDHRKNASTIRDTLPDLSSALGEYARNLDLLLDVTRSFRVRALFLTQPTLWTRELPEHLRDLLWMGGVGNFQAKPGSQYYSVEALAEGMDLYNRALMKKCRETGAECLDLASALPRDTRVFYDDCHFNEGGARAVAAILARYYRDRGLPPESGAGPGGAAAP
jgi:hypothetical protein